MTTPYLVPWESLEEDVRELDRQFVRALPDVLADAGLLLRRVGSPSEPDRVDGGPPGPEDPRVTEHENQWPGAAGREARSE